MDTIVPERITHSLILVILEFPDIKVKKTPFDVNKNIGMKRGTLYPLLKRMVKYGFLSGEWKLPNIDSSERPVIYYSLTQRGRDFKEWALEHSQNGRILKNRQR